MKASTNTRFPSHIGDGLAIKRRTPIPHEFVLEALASLSPRTHPMFGCLAIYVAEKIVLILRDKKDHSEANGVWLATTNEHHESLRRDFPNMRSIAVLGSGVTAWQNLHAGTADFEESALRACELILAGDPRIGKIPGKRRSSQHRTKQRSASLTRARQARKKPKTRARK